MTTPVRVLVADDQRLMRDGIASLLGLQEGIEIVGTAVNGQDALEQAHTLSPDVILMDIRMPVLDGVKATRQVCQQLPDCQVLMLTTFDDEEYIIEALQAGASGYLLKDVPAQDLAEAIRMTHRGIYQLDPAVAAKLVGAFTKPTTKPLTSSVNHELSGRELDVLRLIATGATNRQIALELMISEGTVKNHVSNILSRLGLRARTQAALYAREHGLI